MLTAKNVGHVHITRKGRKIQTLGQEQRGVRRNRPYRFKGWRKFHAWKRHSAYPRPHRRPGISKMPTCLPTIAGASGVTFQERKEAEQIKISWDKMVVKLWGSRGDAHPARGASVDCGEITEGYVASGWRRRRREKRFQKLAPAKKIGSCENLIRFRLREPALADGSGILRWEAG